LAGGRTSRPAVLNVLIALPLERAAAPRATPPGGEGPRLPPGSATTTC